MIGITTEVVAIITTIFAGFTANYLLEMYKENKKSKKKYSILYQNIFFFKELTLNALNIKVGSIPQPELDKVAGIKNLRTTFDNDVIYQESIKYLLFYNSTDLKDRDYEKIEKIKKHIRDIQMKIFKVDAQIEYSKEVFDYYLFLFNEIKEDINGTEILINDIKKRSNKKSNKKSNINKRFLDLIKVLLGAIIGYIFVSVVNLPQDFFSKLTSLNGTFLMGIGAIFLAILSLYQKKDIEDLNSQIIKFITIEYPSFFLVNILLLTVGIRFEIFPNSSINEEFWRHYDSTIEGLGLFMTIYILYRITVLFKRVLLKVTK